jgi:hypothetical protein
MEIKFRARLGDNTLMYQGTPDIETLESFIWHYGCQNIEQYINLKDCNGKEIYENDILINRNNGHKYNVFRVAGGFGINTHQSDFNFDKKPSLFYDSIGDMQTASFISGNCEIV